MAAKKTFVRRYALMQPVFKLEPVDLAGGVGGTISFFAAQMFLELGPSSMIVLFAVFFTTIMLCMALAYGWHDYCQLEAVLELESRLQNTRGGLDNQD
jgi:hypothetical protein